jgi:hypothetical protein
MTRARNRLLGTRAHCTPAARDADQQEEAGAAVDEAELRPGDLITYAEDGETCATHVALWPNRSPYEYETELTAKPERRL